MTVVAVVMDVAALLLLGVAFLLPAGPDAAGAWSRTGVVMIAVSLVLLSFSVWSAAPA